MHKKLLPRLIGGVIGFALIILFVGSNVFATGSEFYQMVRIDVPNKAAVKAIASAGIDMEGAHYDYQNGYLQLPVSGDELGILDELGYSYIVEIPDLEKYYAQRSMGLTMGGFRTYSEAVAKLDSLHNQYPSLTKLENIGTTHNGNIVWALKVSDNANVEEDEPEVLYTGLTHAREPIGMTICLDFADWLLTNYGSDPYATEIVDGRQCWFIPIVNPDGYLYNQQTDPNGGGMWRKNRRNNGNGSYGVDPNRNYTYNWGYDDNGSSPDPWDETYRGPYAGSEPINQAVMQLCQQHNFQLALHYHSYSDYFLYPWGYADIFTPDQPLFSAIADSAVTFNGYIPGTAWQLLYNVNGDALDWSYGDVETKNRIFGFTPEVGSWYDGFWPNPANIPGLVAENRPVNVFFALLSENIWGIIPPYPPVIDEMGTDDDGNYTVSWQVVAGDTLPDRFELQEMTGPQLSTDGAENGTDNWVMDNFTRTSSQHYSGSYSFYSGQGDSYHATMTSAMPIDVTGPMNLTFHIKYNTETNYDYGYVEVSTDGQTYDILDSFNGSSGWISKSYSLNSYIGQSVYVRFRYETDGSVTDPGFWVDDIYPVQTFDNITTLSDNITSHSYDVTGRTPGTYYYRVKGHNDVGWGSFSPAEDITVTGNAPDMEVVFTPIDPPINVPQGGSFHFDASVTNNENNGQSVDCWIGLQLPSGSHYGPLDIYYDVYFPPNQTVNYNNLTQDIPTFAPLGTYTYIGYIGNYPNDIYDSSYFNFTVVSSAGDYGADAWTLHGWPGTEPELNGTIPTETALVGNYPNPFNARTTIQYNLAQPGKVSLKIYNLQGRLVETLVNGYRNAGEHTVNWDAGYLSSGIYFYRLQTENYTLTKKMNLLK